MHGCTISCVLSSVFLEELINIQLEGEQTNAVSFASPFLSVNHSPSLLCFLIPSSFSTIHPSIHPSIHLLSPGVTTGLSVWWSQGLMYFQTPVLERTSTWRSSMSASLTVSTHAAYVNTHINTPIQTHTNTITLKYEHVHANPQRLN